MTLTPALRYRPAWLGLGFAFVAFVIYESLTPSPLDVGEIEGVKAGHLVAYGWLTLWFAQVYRSAGTRMGIGLAFALMGAALEYAQAWTGYRTFSYGDMRDNGLGVAVGLGLAWTPLANVLLEVERVAGGARKEVR